MLSNDLRRVSKLYIKVLGQYLPEPHSEFMAETMLLIAHSKTPVTLERLLTYLENDKRTIVKSLQELVNIGYVSVEKVTSVRKDDRLNLTQVGRVIIPEIEEAVAIAENKLKGQANIDLQAFSLALRKIELNLNKLF
jgi:DNA-binding MarR family transcriptional regulator